MKLIILLLFPLFLSGQPCEIKPVRYDTTQEAQAGRIAVDLVNAFYDLQGDKTGGNEWEIAKDMARFAVKEMKKVSKNHRFLDMVIKQIKAQVYD